MMPGHTSSYDISPHAGEAGFDNSSWHVRIWGRADSCPTPMDANDPNPSSNRRVYWLFLRSKLAKQRREIFHSV